MSIIPSPVQELYQQPLQQCPQGVATSNNNEVFILNSSQEKIFVYNMENFNQTYVINTGIRAILDIWYVAACDGILFLERAPNSAKVLFKLCINWRTKPYNKSPKQQVTEISFPRTVLYPTSWQFQQIIENEMQILCIGSFEPESNPTAEVYEKSIFLISENLCILWDYLDRPRLRVVIILPIATSLQPFSFISDHLAIVISGSLFILQIEKGEEKKAPHPFIPGGCCFELFDNLDINFGLADSQTSNFLFIARSLPNWPAHVNIVFKFTPPGTPKNLHFLSPSSLVLITDTASLVCRVRHTDRDNEAFDPSNLSTFKAANHVEYNDNYIVLWNESKLEVYPNLDKTSLDISASPLKNLYSKELKNMQYVKLTNNILFVITATKNASKVFCYNIGNVDDIVNAALASESLEIQKTGLCLLAKDSSRFAEICCNIGLSLIDKRGQQKEAIDFLISAINAKVPITGKKRAEVIDKIIHLPGKSAHSAFEQMFLLEDDITEDMLNMILKLPKDAALRKLMRAKKFGIDIGESESPMHNLYNAISLSHDGKHEEAMKAFDECDISLIEKLDFDVIMQVSQDISPKILIKIEQPDLPNNEWSYNERMLSYHFMKGDTEKALQVAQTISSFTLHTEEWPVVPEKCLWLDGNKGERFAAACAIKYDGINVIPDEYKNIVNGVYAAKNMRFAEALDILKGRINVLKFLRYFATSPNAWMSVIKQVNDPEISEYARHFLLGYSPSDDFNNATKNNEEHDLDDVIKVLNDTDTRLLFSITPSGGM